MRVTNNISYMDNERSASSISLVNYLSGSTNLLKDNLLNYAHKTQKIFRSKTFIKNMLISGLGAFIGHMIGGVDCAIIMIFVTTLFEDIYETFQNYQDGNQNILRSLIQKLFTPKVNSGVQTCEITDYLNHDHQDLIYEKEATVMFTDIRNFSALSEQLNCMDSFRILKTYMNVMLPIINQNRGLVNQVMGDGILSVFHDSPDQAIETAIEMQQAIGELNKKENLSLTVGIGIATGNIVAGKLDMNQSNLFITSDTVNTAKRIEEMTKQFVSKILLCSESVEKSSYIFKSQVQSLGSYKVKGKKNSVHIHALLMDKGNQLHSRLSDKQRQNRLQVA